jgi:hypothetical protein
MVVTIVLSFTLPLKDGVILFEVALENPYLFILLGLELLSIVLTLFAKQKAGKLAKLLVDILCILTFVVINIVLPIFSLNSFIYLVVLVMISLTSLLNLNN